MVCLFDIISCYCQQVTSMATTREEPRSLDKRQPEALGSPHGHTLSGLGAEHPLVSVPNLLSTFSPLLPASVLSPMATASTALPLLLHLPSYGQERVKGTAGPSKQD